MARLGRGFPNRPALERIHTGASGPIIAYVNSTAAASSSLVATGSATTWTAYGVTAGPTDAAADTLNISVGVEFYVTQGGLSCTGLRWWQAPGVNTDISPRSAALFNATTNVDETILVSKTAISPSGTGWQTIAFDTPYPLIVNQRYKGVIFHPLGSYSATSTYFATVDITNGPLTVPAIGSAVGGGQNTYRYWGSLTNATDVFGSPSYWIDTTVTGAVSTTDLYGSGYIAHGYIDSGTTTAPIVSTSSASSVLTAKIITPGGIIAVSTTISLLHAVASGPATIIATAVATSSIAAKVVILAVVVSTASVTSSVNATGSLGIYGNGYTGGYSTAGSDGGTFGSGTFGSSTFGNLNATLIASVISTASVTSFITAKLIIPAPIASTAVTTSSVIATKSAPIVSTASTIGLLNAITSTPTGIIATSTTTSSLTARVVLLASVISTASVTSTLTSTASGSASATFIARGILNPSATIQRPGNVSLIGSGLLGASLGTSTPIQVTLQAYGILLATGTARRSMGGGLIAQGILSALFVGPDLYPGLSILFTEIQGLADISLEPLGTATLFV